MCLIICNSLYSSRKLQTSRVSSQAFRLLLPAASLKLTALHPADTFRLLENKNGTRSWEKTLAYPIVHIVAARQPSRENKRGAD